MKDKQMHVEQMERWRQRSFVKYRGSNDYKANQAWKDFRKRDGKQVVEVSIMELAERLRAILGGKHE
jgi:hypothetical protein